MVKPLSHITLPQRASEFWSWNVVDWHVASPLHIDFMHKRIQNKICWQATMRARLWTRCMDLRVKWKRSTLPRCQNCSPKCTTGCHWPIVLTAESWSVCCVVQTFLCVCLHMILTDLVWFQVMHGGLFSRDDVTLDEITKIDRNRQPPEEGKYQHYHQILSILVTTSRP